MRPRKCIIENTHVRVQTPGTAVTKSSQRQITGKHIFGVHLKEIKNGLNKKERDVPYEEC